MCDTWLKEISETSEDNIGTSTSNTEPSETNLGQLFVLRSIEIMILHLKFHLPRSIEISHPGVIMAIAGLIAGRSQLSSIVLVYELLLGPVTKW